MRRARSRSRSRDRSQDRRSRRDKDHGRQRPSRSRERHEDGRDRNQDRHGHDWSPPRSRQPSRYHHRDESDGLGRDRRKRHGSPSPPRLETSRSDILTTVPLHPLLSATATKEVASATSKRLPIAAVSSVKANVRAGESSILQQSAMIRKRGPEPSAVDRFLAIRPTRSTAKNPHFDRSLPRLHHGPRLNPLRFVEPGSLVAEAEERRTREEFEALRREVADSLANVGIDTDIVSDLMTAESVPDIEWWDRPFQGTIVGPRFCQESEGQPPKELCPSLTATVTNLIQRPALLPPPSDELSTRPKPLFLTTEERKKLRRQRRLTEHREHQERIKLGLLPPPPPKTRIANIARVLGVQAVAEPSRLEAELRAAAAVRHERHLQANRERQETARQIPRDPAPHDRPSTDFLSVLVIRIDDDIYQVPQWRFKVTKNAQQYGLTGCMVSLASRVPGSSHPQAVVQEETTGPATGSEISRPTFTLIVAEGGATAIRRYKHLLLERIKWDQPPSPAIDGQDASAHPQPSPTRCHLVWEGQQAESHYRGFVARTLPTELDVLEYLAPHQGDHFWRTAKSMC